MRKIEKRSIFCLILAALLGLGLAFFCFRFVVDGGDWEIGRASCRERV